jgi:hypothetical protein
MSQHEIQLILERLEGFELKLDEHIKNSGEHWEITRTFIEEMTPGRDGIRVLKGLNAFFKWLGLPTLGALVAGFVYWLFK